MKILIIIISYLFGSLSLGQIMAVKRGIQLNKIGTKNPGAYNIYHQMGANLGILSGAFDVLKGTIPVYIGKELFNFDFSFIIMIAAAAILGHMWPIFFKFKGGRGLATTVGAMLVLDFYLALYILVLAALLTFWIRDLTSFKPRVSLILCPLYIIGAYYFRSNYELLIFGFILTILLYFKALFISFFINQKGVSK
ncbi:MAG: glycerol-3-phosphate acyltransferase [Halanaerobiales bacterium]|nr:glycerol-3-phosphate acyltransferase [Halanaerobiales bacterium]